LSNVAQGLSDLFNQIGDYQQALFYQKKKQEYTQKEFDQAEMQQANKLEAQFENKRLLNDIQESRQKALNRMIQLILLTGVCIFLIIILILVRNSFKSKHKLQEERNLRLQQQKLDMELQAELQLTLQKEQEFRLLSEQKLLNIQMDQMQKESLADSLQIERKNRLLLRLKDKLKDLETQENVGFIDRMIRQEMVLDEKVSQSVKEFKNIHPEFFQKLKEISSDKLSTLELKHCAHIHLKLSTKEIAAAFHIEPKSVRVSKYRIKQKLQLDKEVDLDNFLQTLLDS
ncbi:MAG: helix-turn-helix transcriptional regulator, partial [Sphingobacterium sp.]